jgi:hypothetical protein
MKKILVLIGMLAMISTMSFADGNSCSVSGIEGAQVSLYSNNQNSDNKGEVTAHLKYYGPDKTGSVNVMVHCYTYVNGQKTWVAAKSANVSLVTEGGSVTFEKRDGIEPNKAYTFELRDATCY